MTKRWLVLVACLFALSAWAEASPRQLLVASAAEVEMEPMEIVVPGLTANLLSTAQHNNLMPWPLKALWGAWAVIAAASVTLLWRRGVA